MWIRWGRVVVDELKFGYLVHFSVVCRRGLCMISSCSMSSQMPGLVGGELGSMWTVYGGLECIRWGMHMRLGEESWNEIGRWLIPNRHGSTWLHTVGGRALGPSGVSEPPMQLFSQRRGRRRVPNSKVGESPGCPLSGNWRTLPARTLIRSWWWTIDLDWVQPIRWRRQSNDIANDFCNSGAWWRSLVLFCVELEGCEQIPDIRGQEVVQSTKGVHLRRLSIILRWKYWSWVHMYFLWRTASVVHFCTYWSALKNWINT